MLFKVSFSDGLAIAGIVAAFILVVLDKAGKLKGPTLLALLAGAFLMTLPLAFSVTWVSDSPPGIVRFSRSLCMLFVVGLLYALIAAWITSGEGETTTTATTSVPDQEKPPTLKLLMEGFLPNTMRVFGNPDVTFPDGNILKIEDVIYLDFPGGSKCTGFYIPSSSKTYELGVILAGHALKLSTDLTATLKITGRSPGENPQKVDSLVHTGKIYVYHDDFLTKRQSVDIEEAFQKQKLDVVLRGPDYLSNAWLEWQRRHDDKKKATQSGGPR